MFRLPVQEYIAVPKLPFLFLEFREHFFKIHIFLKIRFERFYIIFNILFIF